jgi:hypothetical protein
MRVLRSRANGLAAFALTWQILALMVAPAVLCGQKGAGPSAVSEMTNCPMHHEAGETCPMHESAPPDQGAGRLGCSQSDTTFLALFSFVGVLPPATETPILVRVGVAVSPASPSSVSLAPVPVSPPPRA